MIEYTHSERRFVILLFYFCSAFRSFPCRESGNGDYGAYFSYFERFAGPVCDRAFIMERVVGKELAGFDNRVIGGIQSRRQCEELCLQEQAFPCR